MIRKIFMVMSFLMIASFAEARMIKVLIMDDVFQGIPQKDEKIEKMGKLSGDLLVNGAHYVGDIEVYKGTSGLYLINELPLEDYVKNVVSAEVGTNWEMEALKAQAVIARTYAIFQKTATNNTNYDLTSSVLHQVYKGANVDARISYAVMNTHGEILTYENKVIEAFYHSTCGGKTEAPEEVFNKKYPYLKPVSSSCELSPYWIWERKIPLEDMEKALNLKSISNIDITSLTSTGRVKTVDITHGSGTTSFKTTELRKFLGWSRLPSTNFTVTIESGNAVFEGKGYGHGVGLCQWSALEMAKNGKTYREILSFFYPGTIIELDENH